MYRAFFYLKQHTPIIHFQGDANKVVGLRATEVKSRLDRHILMKYQLHMDCFVDKNYNKKALDYRMKIENRSNRADYIEKTNSLLFKAYYANLKDSNPSERFLFFNEGLLLKITTFQPDLFKILCEEVPVFFARNNFGKRNSKGFGSFTVEKVETNQPQKIVLKDLDTLLGDIHRIKLMYDKNANDDKDIKFALLNEAYRIYQGLKSGIRNYQSFLMKKYMKSRSLGNERDCTISRLFKPDQSSKKIDPSKARYARGLLGLCETVNFPLKDKSKLTIKQNVKENAIGSPIKVKRFKSPITIKIVDETVYFLKGEIPDIMYDLTVSVEKENKTINENNSKNGEKLYKIKTPAKEEFDLTELLRDFAVDLKETDENSAIFGANKPTIEFIEGGR